jgi:LuxR family maltose regulon positive regulatory protein
VQIATGDEDALQEAGQNLERFIQHAETTHYRLAHLEAFAVRAVLLETRHQVGAATEALRASLDLAAPERIIQRYTYLGAPLVPILRRLTVGRTPHPYARTVLDAVEAVQDAQPKAVDAPKVAQLAHLSSPLTARELEILNCLARRLTNDEIGDELYISPITVKHHVANVSSKLAVSGRRAVVARARELGLLEA